MEHYFGKDGSLLGLSWILLWTGPSRDPCPISAAVLALFLVPGRPCSPVAFDLEGVVLAVEGVEQLKGV
jgi:hypothetical protein